MPLPTCIVIGCSNATHQKQIKYYQVPIRNPNICKQWYINTLREDLQCAHDHFVCVEHFDEESFHSLDNGTPSQELKDDAVPSLFEIEVFQKMIAHQEMVTNSSTSRSNIQAIDFQNLTNYTKSNENSLLSNLINGVTAPRQNCSILNCVNHSQYLANVELFNLPKISEIARKWQLASNIFSDDLKLCRNHFVSSDFNEYNFLKPDAVPSIFESKSSSLTSSATKRARIDPEQRAALMQRVPKAVKRTSAIVGQNVPFYPINTNTNRMPKAVKHTAHMQPHTQTHRNARFLSEALNSSPSILASTMLAQPTSTPSENRRGPKAVKHTTANSLLKEILPPPIMQSTKRSAQRAVKHTFNQTPFQQQLANNSSIKLTVAAPTTSTKLSQSHSTYHNQPFKSQQQQQQIHMQNEAQPPKTTYIYKRIYAPPEIELHLECEEVESESEMERVKAAIDTAKRHTTPKNTIQKRRQSALASDTTSEEEENANSSSSSSSFSPISAKTIKKMVTQTPSLATQRPKRNIQQPKKLTPPPLEPTKTRAKSTRNSEGSKQLIFDYYSRKKSSRPDDEKQGDFKGKCNICECILSNNIELTSHICSHLEGASYISPFDAVTTSCSVCDEEFQDPFELIKHLDLVHMKKLNEYKCRICEKQHANLDTLIRHLQETHVHSEMPYRCDSCQFRTSYYADAIYHIKKEHMNTLRYFCPYCLKSFLMCYDANEKCATVNNFYSHLITHFNKHEDDELIESKCKHCTKCILHVRYKKEHELKDHGKCEMSDDTTTDTTQAPVVVAQEEDEANKDTCIKKIQKATKSTTSNNRKHKFSTRSSLLASNDFKLKQFRLLKEQQKPYDQFEIFALQDDSESEQDEALSSLKKISHLKFNYGKYRNESTCLECGNARLSGHFRNYYECHQCKYNTLCSTAFEHHLHKHLKSIRAALWNKPCDDSYFYQCECSRFDCNNGNQMAEHYLNCDFKSCHVFQIGSQI